MTAAIVKVCPTCSATYTQAAWERLELKGEMDDRASSADGERLELRNCSCGSTIAIVLERNGGPVLWLSPPCALSCKVPKTDKETR